jgi:hypothetical protein
MLKAMAQVLCNIEHHERMIRTNPKNPRNKPIFALNKIGRFILWFYGGEKNWDETIP